MSKAILDAHLAWINDEQTGLRHLPDCINEARNDFALHERITSEEFSTIVDVANAKKKRLLKEQEEVKAKPKQKSLF